MPDGRWMWVHYPQDAATLVAKLKQCGASGVLLKYHEGASPVDNTGFNYQIHFRSLIGPLRQAGFGVAAWGYNYPDSADAEAQLISQAFTDGADWYCFDAETEFEGKQQAASELCAAVRKALPEQHLAFAPFPFADLHTTFPYAEFDAVCQACLPQIYAGLIGRRATDGTLDVDGDYNSCYESLYGGKPLTLKSAFVPCFSIDDGETQANVGRMLYLAKNGGYSGTAWWSLDDASDAALTALGTPEGPPTAAAVPAAPNVTEALADLQAAAKALGG